MSDGALMELVSRGKQDAFFTQNPTHTWFGADYVRRNGGTREVRRVEPTTPCLYGARVDIDLPRYGDILQAAYVRIQLPTWLPPAVAAINRDPNVTVEVQSATYPTKSAAFGWTNGIANFLISRWQLYADNLCISEGYGEINTWYPFMNATQNQAPIMNATTGQHDGSATSIQYNATPPELTFRVPIPGCQYIGDCGLPLWAMRSHQRLFLRLWILPLEKCVESSAIFPFLGGTENAYYEICPAPWGGKQITIKRPGLPDDTSYRTLQVYEMGQPIIYGHYEVIHLDEDARAGLLRTPISIPFKYQMLDIITFDQATFIPGNSVTKRLDIKGFFESLYLRFISTARFLENKYRDTAPPVGGEWITQMSLVVNGIERVQNWDPVQYREMTLKTRVGRDVPDFLYYMVFGQDVDHTPAGALYLTRSHKVQLNFTLADTVPDPLTGRQADVGLLGIGWNILDVRDGFCVLRFAD